MSLFTFGIYYDISDISIYYGYYTGILLLFIMKLLLLFVISMTIQFIIIYLWEFSPSLWPR